MNLFLSLLLLFGFFIDLHGEHAICLVEKEHCLIDLIYKADSTLLDCKDELEIARKVLSVIHQITTAPYGFTWCTDVNHNQVTAQEFYEKVTRNYEPVLCGGINTFFSKVLNEYFNIDAFVIDIGKISTLYTHITTVVYVKDENKFVLFDAHYGCYFTSSDGSHLDLESIFKDSPFVLNCLDVDKVYVLDAITTVVKKVFEEIEKGKASFLGNTSETRALFSRPSDGWIYKKSCNLQEDQRCSWRDTCVLQYLDFGALFGLSCPSYDVGVEFLKMLERNNIQVTFGASSVEEN